MCTYRVSSAFATSWYICRVSRAHAMTGATARSLANASLVHLLGGVQFRGLAVPPFEVGGTSAVHVSCGACHAGEEKDSAKGLIRVQRNQLWEAQSLPLRLPCGRQGEQCGRLPSTPEGTVRKASFKSGRNSAEGFVKVRKEQCGRLL